MTPVELIAFARGRRRRDFLEREERMLPLVYVAQLLGASDVSLRALTGPPPE